MMVDFRVHKSLALNEQTCAESNKSNITILANEANGVPEWKILQFVLAADHNSLDSKVAISKTPKHKYRYLRWNFWIKQDIKNSHF